MLWPYVVFTFVSLTLFALGFVAAGVVSLCAMAVWLVADYRRIERRLLPAIAAGIAGGVLLFTLRTSALQQREVAESGEAVVSGLSRKSIVISTGNGNKIRLTGLRREQLPVKYARIAYQCTQQPMPEATFSAFERLSGVSAWCRAVNIRLLAAPTGKFIVWRQAVMGYLTEKFSRLGEKSLIAAFLIGDTDSLSTAELEAFRDMGLMHLFAVSGLNIALLFAIIYLPFRFARLPALGAAIGYTVASGFLLLLDFPVPLLRAWLFMTIGLGMRLIDRRITSWALLFLTAVIVELLFPLSTFTISFILSFGVTAAILLLYQPIYFCFAPASKFGRLCSAHLALTLAAGLPAMIMGFFLFGSANPLSLVYNLLLVPFSGLYLFSSLIYFLFEPARHLLILLDALYLKFADLHLHLISSRFPYGDGAIQRVVLSILAVALVLLVALSLRHRLWLVKRRIALMTLLLAILLCVPYAFASYPQQAFYALPNQVWIYHEGKLTITGKKIFAENADPRLCFPLREKNAATLTAENSAAGEIHRDHSGRCYLFAGRLRPEAWGNNALKNCHSIEIFQSKKQETASAEWDQLFRLFGFQGKTTLRKFFTWYGDKPAPCIKEIIAAQR